MDPKKADDWRIIMLKKRKKKVGTFKNMPYTAINAIGGCLMAGFLCTQSKDSDALIQAFPML